MFLRKIGKFLRGKATPFQIISATLLGGLLGSLPGVTQGPLLLLTLLFLLIVLNANLFLAALAGLVAKLLYLILLPVYFSVGMSLLEGPLNGPVAALVNAPFTAWWGLDHYVMVPSLLVGGLFGLFSGIGISRALYAFRRKMADLETGSETYQAYTSKFWVRALAWLFLGGLKGKKSWAELGEQRKGLPVRPLGIVFVLSLCVLLFVGYKMLDEEIVTSMVRDSLERANGATVDIELVDIQPANNRIVVNGLALADPENLQTNRFASETVVADFSGLNLLAKKVVIDSIQVKQPKVGTERKLVGRRTVPPPEPVEEVAEGEEKTLDDYLGQARVWRERLDTLKRFYDRIAPHLKKEDSGEAGEPGWRERLAQRASEGGYASVKSESLIRKSPRLWIRDIQADNIEIGGNDDRFAFTGANLSTHPTLVEERGQLRVERADGRLAVELELPDRRNPTRSQLSMRLTGLLVEDLEAEIERDLPLEGGTLDIEGKGAIDSGLLELPVKVIMKDTTLNAFGTSLALDEFPLEVRVHGPLENPRLDIPSDALEEAVKTAGKKKVEGMIEEKAGDLLKGLFPKD